jgi:hypothetical protein
MRKSIIAGLALWAAFVAFAGKVQADVNYPWCVMGETRGFECVFSSREQCAQDGRNRGFGGQCIQNPAYKPGAPTALQTSRPSRAVSAAQSTCTGVKSDCLSLRYLAAPRTVTNADPEVIRQIREQNKPYRAHFCNIYWDECMKTGWWAHAVQVERR